MRGAVGVLPPPADRQVQGCDVTVGAGFGVRTGVEERRGGVERAVVDGEVQQIT